MSDVNRGQATRFAETLSKPKSEGGFGLAKTSSARRTIGHCKQFWIAAINEERTSRNPFQHLAAKVLTNPERHHQVDLVTSIRILDAMPNLVWQLRFVLMRWQGLRCASELNALPWDGVNWADQTMLIISPKTKNSPGKESRVAAIMPEVLPLLKQMYDQSEPGAKFVLPRLAHKNYTECFKEYLQKTGIEIWDAIFVNLRRSAVNDAHDRLPVPPHVIDAWFGHCESVSRQYYRTVNDSHFESIKNYDPATTQITTQQASETPDLIGTEQNAPTARPSELPKKRLVSEQIRQLPERSRWTEKVKMGDEGLEPPTSTV